MTDIINLDEETILNYEFLHDNKSDKSILKDTKVFDMIERKIFTCKKISNPELIMKENLFRNIKYGNVSISNILEETITENRLVELNKMKMKQNIFLVFDNKQLTLTNIELINLIFENKNIVVFIPFIFSRILIR